MHWWTHQIGGNNLNFHKDQTKRWARTAAKGAKDGSAQSS